MKAVTIHVEEPVYEEFKMRARQDNRSTSELIREAMLEYQERKLLGKTYSLIDPWPAASVGEILEPWENREELLSTFWDRT